MQKRKLTDWILLVLFVLTAISGIKLHVATEDLGFDHETHIWSWIHSMIALLFIITAIIHVKHHFTWYKALKYRVNKREIRVRRIAVISTDALYILLLCSGIILIPLPLGTITTVGTFHFVIGIAAIIFSIGHIIKRAKLLK